jgi:hypothetical protein
MAPRKADKGKEKDLVMPVDEMLILNLRKHIQARHPRMRFRSKGEHEADHRLFPQNLDHIHSNQKQPKEETDAENGS